MIPVLVFVSREFVENLLLVTLDPGRKPDAHQLGDIEHDLDRPERLCEVDLDVRRVGVHQPVNHMGGFPDRAADDDGVENTFPVAQEAVGADALLQSVVLIGAARGNLKLLSVTGLFPGTVPGDAFRHVHHLSRTEVASLPDDGGDKQPHVQGVVVIYVEIGNLGKESDQGVHLPPFIHDGQWAVMDEGGVSDRVNGFCRWRAYDGIFGSTQPEMDIVSPVNIPVQFVI